MKRVSKEIKDLGGTLFGDNTRPYKKRKVDSKKSKQKNKKAAWYDPEDDELTVAVGKKRQHHKLRESFEENELIAADYIDRQRKRYPLTDPLSIHCSLCKDSFSLSIFVCNSECHQNVISHFIHHQFVGAMYQIPRIDRKRLDRTTRNAMERN